MRRIDLTTWGRRSMDATGVAGCIVLTLVAYFAAIRPHFRQQSALASQESHLAVQRLQAVALAKPMATLRGRVRDVKQALEMTPLKLKPASEVAWHLARLAELASDSGLEMGEARLGERSDATRYQLVPVQVAAKGALHPSLRPAAR